MEIKRSFFKFLSATSLLAVSFPLTAFAANEKIYSISQNPELATSGDGLRSGDGFAASGDGLSSGDGFAASGDGLSSGDGFAASGDGLSSGDGFAASGDGSSDGLTSY